MEVDKSDQDWNTDGKKGRSSFNANLEPVIPRADLVLFQDTHNEQRGQNRGGLFSGRGGRGRGRGFRGQRGFQHNSRSDSQPQYESLSKPYKGDGDEDWDESINNEQGLSDVKQDLNDKTSNAQISQNTDDQDDPNQSSIQLSSSLQISNQTSSLLLQSSSSSTSSSQLNSPWGNEVDEDWKNNDINIQNNVKSQQITNKSFINSNTSLNQKNENNDRNSSWNNITSDIWDDGAPPNNSYNNFRNQQRNNNTTHHSKEKRNINTDERGKEKLTHNGDRQKNDSINNNEIHHHHLHHHHHHHSNENSEEFNHVGINNLEMNKKYNKNNNDNDLNYKSEKLSSSDFNKGKQYNDNNQRTEKHEIISPQIKKDEKNQNFKEGDEIDIKHNKMHPKKRKRDEEKSSSSVDNDNDNDNDSNKEKKHQNNHKKDEQSRKRKRGRSDNSQNIESNKKSKSHNSSKRNHKKQKNKRQNNDEQIKGKSQSSSTSSSQSSSSSIKTNRKRKHKKNKKNKTKDEEINNDNKQNPQNPYINLQQPYMFQMPELALKNQMNNNQFGFPTFGAQYPFQLPQPNFPFLSHVPSQGNITPNQLQSAFNNPFFNFAMWTALSAQNKNIPDLTKNINQNTNDDSDDVIFLDKAPEQRSDYVKPEIRRTIKRETNEDINGLQQDSLSGKLQIRFQDQNQQIQHDLDIQNVSHNETHEQNLTNIANMPHTQFQNQLPNQSQSNKQQLQSNRFDQQPNSISFEHHRTSSQLNTDERNRLDQIKKIIGSNQNPLFIAQISSMIKKISTSTQHTHHHSHYSEGTNDSQTNINSNQSPNNSVKFNQHPKILSLAELPDHLRPQKNVSEILMKNINSKMEALLDDEEEEDGELVDQKIDKDQNIGK